MPQPRPEYPRPQCVRSDWLCLNGLWQFEIDSGDSGQERGLLQRELAGSITVPFCPESELSGIGNADFLNAVWYRRQVDIPGAWAGRDVLLHFQAVDYEATVWVNGREVGRHRGGFTPFTCDLAGVAEAGQTATVVVRARDRRDPLQPSGKQSYRYANAGCHYTRTTGIWQTVWIEPVPRIHLGRPKITPDVGQARFVVEQPITNSRPGTQLRMTLSDDDGPITTEQCAADTDFTTRVLLAIPAQRLRLWRPDDPHLYDLSVDLLDAEGRRIDNLTSYAGLRSVTIDGPAIKINGQAVFQRLVLDQGYWPDGLMTAPSDAALRRDIELALKAGFNGARLHQKVFEERFLYHADRMGYLVWGEFGGIWWNPDAAPNGPSWGYGKRPTSVEEFYQRFEKLCTVLLDHPAMFGYCYTQLTDVFQEQNGIYGFDRCVKFDMARIRAAQQRPAAIENQAGSTSTMTV